MIFFCSFIFPYVTVFQSKFTEVRFAHHGRHLLNVDSFYLFLFLFLLSIILDSRVEERKKRILFWIRLSSFEWSRSLFQIYYQKIVNRQLLLPSLFVLKRFLWFCVLRSWSSSIVRSQAFPIRDLFLFWWLHIRTRAKRRQ